MAIAPAEPEGVTRFFFLNDIVGTKVYLQDAKVGKLADLIATPTPALPTVTQIMIGRPFGNPPLFVPWEDVSLFSEGRIVVRGSDLTKYLTTPPESAIFLKDYVKDKKVLDIANREVEIVYDIRFTSKGGKLYVSDVDLNRHRLARRLGLDFLARNKPEDITNPKLVSWAYVQPLENVSSFSGDIHLRVLREKLADLPPTDLADVLEVMDREDRVQVFHSLDNQTAAQVLGETEPRVQREILASTSAERVEQIFTHLSPAEIAEIVSILPRDGSREILAALKGDIAARVHQILSEYDVPAAALAVHRLLLLPGDLTVDEAFKRFRLQAPFCDVTMYVYVVGTELDLQGVVDINELLQAHPESRLDQIMTRTVVTVSPSSMRDEVESLFRKYRFRAIPIVDSARHVVGAVRERDAFLRYLPA
ncbi:MAG TPA: CBS domain-containing protein [Thermoplasmata archaeon]|nr:CBS domain-containing protein [Thermoplasmata archaeon]